MKKLSLLWISLLLVLSLILSACQGVPTGEDSSIASESSITSSSESSLESSAESSPDSDSSEGTDNPELSYSQAAAEGYIDISQIPTYSGSPYYTIGDNTPDFSKALLRSSSFEYYGDLDHLHLLCIHCLLRQRGGIVGACDVHGAEALAPLLENVQGLQRGREGVQYHRGEAFAG